MTEERVGHLMPVTQNGTLRVWGFHDGHACG
jgi:hypothetical protein